MVSDVKYKSIDGERLEKLTTKQMIQRLPITLAHVKGGNTSVNLWNKLDKFCLLYIEQK